MVGIQLHDQTTIVGYNMGSRLPYLKSLPPMYWIQELHLYHLAAMSNTKILTSLKVEINYILNYNLSIFCKYSFVHTSHVL